MVTKHSKNSDVWFYRLAVTVVLSVFVGWLAAMWRYKILDPEGTGGGILALPISITLFPLCGLLFLLGILTLDRSFGPYLVMASFLIVVSFFIINGLLSPQ